MPRPEVLHVDPPKRRKKKSFAVFESSNFDYGITVGLLVEELAFQAIALAIAINLDKAVLNILN